jgi:isoprenylcysteine carboxyl methyltransferase (ICMT) family protein YpbQ
MKFSPYRLIPIAVFIVGLAAFWLGEKLFAQPQPQLIPHREVITPNVVPNGVTAGLTAEFLVQAGVTAILLIATLLVILSKRYAADDKHWAYATIGTIVGFWLKTSA